MLKNGDKLTASRLITIQHNWRVIYEVASAFIGLILLLAFFTFPETAYNREEKLTTGLQAHHLQQLPASPTNMTAGSDKADEKYTADVEHASSSDTPPQRKSYLQLLNVFSGNYTTEPFYKIFLRPMGLICLPPVLWSALVESVTIGFVVAVTSNVDTAFEATYGFESWQVGLCFISACVGSLVGIPAGGHLGDRVADYFTRRNGGMREPEMRLPAMVPSLVTTPLALILYGVGIQKKLHWMCPTVGLGLCKSSFPSCLDEGGFELTACLSPVNFSIVQGTNVCLVYVIDAYRPVAGEVTLAVMGFKCKYRTHLPPPCSLPAPNPLRPVWINFCAEVSLTPLSPLRLPPLLLHEPMGRRVGLPERLRRHGGHICRHHNPLDPAVHMGQENPPRHLELAGRLFDPLG